MTHGRAVAGGLLVTAAACVLAWALAFPGRRCRLRWSVHSPTVPRW